MAKTYNPPVVDRPGTGVLFFRYNEAGSKRPNLMGAANIDGFQYEIAAWEKTSKAGKAYVYLMLKRVEPADAAELPTHEFKKNWNSFRNGKPRAE